MAENYEMEKEESDVFYENEENAPINEEEGENEEDEELEQVEEV